MKSRTKFHVYGASTWALLPIVGKLLRRAGLYMPLAVLVIAAIGAVGTALAAAQVTPRGPDPARHVIRAGAFGGAIAAAAFLIVSQISD